MELKFTILYKLAPQYAKAAKIIYSKKPQKIILSAVKFYSDQIMYQP